MRAILAWWKAATLRYARQPSGPLSSKNERAGRLLFEAVRRNVFDTLNSPYILLSFDEMEGLFWGKRAFVSWMYAFDTDPSVTTDEVKTLYVSSPAKVFR